METKVRSLRDSLSLAVLALLLTCCGSESYRSLPTVRIPPGMRAVSVHVHEDISSVTPGDHVDVLIIDKAQKTRTVLQNVEIVTADQKVGVVTFLVSPDDAQGVTDAGNRGEFSLRLWKSD